MKTCDICGCEFPTVAWGSWCHSCVTGILSGLSVRQETYSKLHETVERIRQQLRDAKAAGRDVDTTECPGPYWGLDIGQGIS